jgi:group I intron endonuclease
MVGIYCIENTLNKKKYIGQAVNIERRKNEHFKLLENNRHPNDHLQKSWNKYGKTNFSFCSIENFDNENTLTEKERYWMNYYNTMNSDFGYNKKEAGKKGKLSQESKNKISLKNKGRKPSENTIKNGILSRKGKHLSVEHRKKISNSEKGRVISNNTREKIRISHCGKNSVFLGKKNNNATSSFYGVYYSKSRNKWIVHLSINGKKIFIGRFCDEIKAGLAYNNFIIQNNLPNPLNNIKEGAYDNSS